MDELETLKKRIQELEDKIAGKCNNCAKEKTCEKCGVDICGQCSRYYNEIAGVTADGLPTRWRQVFICTNCAKKLPCC